MVKKGQLRKYSIEKIMELVNGDTNGENLKIYNEAISDKNKLMLERHVNLLYELDDLRKRVEKVIREMNVRNELTRKALRTGLNRRAKIYWTNIADLQRRTPKKSLLYSPIFRYIKIKQAPTSSYTKKLE